MDPAHTAHRVKLRGLLLDPPHGGSPYVVNIEAEEDFQLFYRSPKVRVKCVVESCDTLLSAKQMKRSGLRFFAIRAGFCNHNEVSRDVIANDAPIDVAPPLGGGGLESSEHTWMKYRLSNICRRLGVESIVEHQPTHADVYIPIANLALEYQRWDTEFVGRTRARAGAGAKTLWMFPKQPPGAPSSKKLVAFNSQVYQHGAVFVSVVDKRNKRLLRPWEDSRLNKYAHLYVSGSVAVIDDENHCFKSGAVPLPTFLDEVLAGTRTLASVVIRERSGRFSEKPVWVKHADLALLRRDLGQRTTSSEKPRSQQTESGNDEPRPAAAPSISSVPDGLPTSPPVPIQIDAVEGSDSPVGVDDSVGLNLSGGADLSLPQVEAAGSIRTGSPAPMVTFWRKVRRFLER